MLKDIESVLLDEQTIQETVKRLADEIRRDYETSEKKLVLLCILKGSLMFTSELMKYLNIPAELEFMKVSSYGSGTVSSHALKIHLDMARERYDDVNILIVEDIVDSGNTLSRLVKYLKEKGASVRTCTLLDKPDRRTTEFQPDYCGAVIPDRFVVGFGLDYNEKYRNLPFVGVLKPEVYTT